VVEHIIQNELYLAEAPRSVKGAREKGNERSSVARDKKKKLKRKKRLRKRERRKEKGIG